MAFQAVRETVRPDHEKSGTLPPSKSYAYKSWDDVNPVEESYPQNGRRGATIPAPLTKSCSIPCHSRLAPSPHSIPNLASFRNPFRLAVIRAKPFAQFFHALGLNHRVLAI